MREENHYLKIKTGLFLFPDFINKGNINYVKLRSNIFDKYSSIAIKEFVQCNECLNLDFDNIINLDNYSCKICGSTNCKKVDPKNFRR